MDFGIIILAIIQGIAEFLPISSSAHLILFRDLFGIGSSITADMELILILRCIWYPFSNFHFLL